MALQNFLVLSLCQLLPPRSPARSTLPMFAPSPLLRRGETLAARLQRFTGASRSWRKLQQSLVVWTLEGVNINRIIILINNNNNSNNNNNKRMKFRSQTSEHMDKWKSRGGKSQRGEEQKREDQTRERVRRKKMQVREKVGKPRKGRKVGL